MSESSPYTWKPSPQQRPTAAPRGQPSQGAPGGAAAGALALLLMAGVVVGGGLWLMGEAQRGLLKMLLWDFNSVAVVSSIAVVVLFFVPVPFVAGKAQRVRWLTDEHRKVIEQRRVAKAQRPTGVLVASAAPVVLVVVVGLSCWAVAWWAGFPRYRFPELPEFELVTWVPEMVEFLEVWGNRWNAWGVPFVWLVDCAVLWMPVAPYWEAVIEQVAARVGQGRLPDPGEYQLRSAGLGRTEPRSLPTMMLGCREYVESREFEPDVALPSWVEYGGKGTLGGMIIFGQKGSGKTSLIKRLIEDLIRFRAHEDDYKPAVVAIDPKGDLSEFIQKTAAKYGRSEDVVRLGVNTEAKWNPFAVLGPHTTAKEAKQAGYFLRCAMSSGGEENAYWDDNADNLLSYSVHLMALAGRRLGFDTLAGWVTLLKEGRDEDRTEMYEQAENNMRRLFKGRELDDRIHELEATKAYFEEEFIDLDDKPRTIIINVATNFLRKFEALDYARSFCCEPDEPGQFVGFPELIRTGGIFVLDVRATENGAIAGAMCMLTKLYYQAAVKQRDRYEPDWSSRAIHRVTATVWDEYQSYVTPSGGGKQGDAEYLETSRSFFAVDIAATQQFSSVEAAVGGHESAAQRVLGNFNNIVTFLHNDPKLTRYMQQITGRREREELRLSVSEGLQGAERDALGTLRESAHSVNQSVQVGRRTEERLPTELFAGLKAFEAVGLLTAADGRKVVRFCSKPYFVDLRTRHEDVLQLALGD